MSEKIVNEEGVTGARCSLPDLKRASSVPIANKPVPVDPFIFSGKPSFKIELPSLDLFGIPYPSRASRTAPTSVPGGLQTISSQRGHGTLGCAKGQNLILDTTISPRMPLLTPPDEATLASREIMSSTEEHGRAVRNQSHGDHVEVSFLPTNQASTSHTGTTSTGAKSEYRPVAEAVHEQGNELPPLSSSSSHSSGGTISWLDQVIDIALSETSTGCGPGNAVRILSHTLPCPPTEIDGTGTSTAFPNLVAAAQNKLISQPSPFISVVHAVPSRFSLSKLPTSPPGTPNSTIGIEASSNGQEDYFNMNVFSSAVPVINHHDTFNKGLDGTPVPSSPYLAVPPSSIDIALLERLIPPASIQEYLDLFAPAGPSALVNRLIEISPNNGTLIFIYPTKTGGDTFTSRCLGPLLDPVLRTMVNSHNLSADLAIDLGRMNAAEHLLNFEAMKRKVNILLPRLSRGTTQEYKLVYSSKETVNLNRRVWVDWFIQQETSRFRHITTRYFQRARRLPTQPHVNYAVLTREITEGLAGRKYSRGEEPGNGDGIEVGVYVIKRRSSS